MGGDSPRTDRRRRERHEQRHHRGVPGHYYNLVDAGRATVEVGTETFDVTVTELTGSDRDRVYAEQASRYPGFADYAKKTEGVRVIPVLKLTRV